MAVRTCSRTRQEVRGFCGIMAKGTLLLILGVAAVRAALDLRAHGRLEPLFQTLEEEGFATCPLQLAPPALAPDENKAPILKAALAVSCELDVFFAADECFEGLEPAEKSKLDLLLTRNARAFDLIRLARNVPKCRFDRTYRCGMFEVEVQEGGALYDAAVALDYKARRDVESDRHEEARETVRDLIGLAEAYREEPLFLSQNQRRRMLDLAGRTAAWCSRRATSSRELAAWLDVVPRPEILDGSAVLVMRGDLAASACRMVLPNPLEPLLGEGSLEAGIGRVMAPFHRNGSVDSFVDYAVDVLRFSDDREAPHRITGPRELPRRIVFDLATLGCIAPARAMENQLFTQTVLAVTRAGLEAELHFIERGCYPERVEVLDPFTGRPLLFDRDQGTIFSAGGPDLGMDSPETVGLLWRLLPR